MSLLTAQNLTFGFLDGVLFKGAAFKVEENDKIGLIGANGTGKTSLFKLIIGTYTPNEGGIVRGKDVRIGYMEQYLECDDNQTLYNEALTVFSDVARMEEELEEINERLLTESSIELIEKQVKLTEEIERRDGLVYKAKTKSALIGLGFSKKDLDLKVNSLSGGQRSKLSLCKLLLSDTNLLLLDEPTNNLDIDAVNWLEDFLIKYKGAVIVVSHDRYFLDNLVDRIFAFEGNGYLQQYEGGYTDYAEAKQHLEVTNTQKEWDKKKTNAKDDWKQNRPTKLKFSYKEQKEYETIDDDIASLEAKIEELDAEMMANATNSAKLSELAAEKEKSENMLEEKMERWVYLNDLAEKIAAQ